MQLVLAFNNDFDDIFSVWKYCQLITHESNTFLFLKTLKNYSNLWGQNPPNLPFLLDDVDPVWYTNAWGHPTDHFKQHIDRSTHFRTTTPQILIGYNGMPHVHPPNFPLPWGDLHLHLLTSNDMQIQSAIFSQSTGQSHRHMHRQTDRWSRQKTCTSTSLCCRVLIENEVANNNQLISVSTQWAV